MDDRPSKQVDVEMQLPWACMVKMKQERDSEILQAVAHYYAISESDAPEPVRQNALRLMQQYQRMYLGFAANPGE